jgi:nucleotide-binding universal stress UspA family protein
MATQPRTVPQARRRFIVVAGHPGVLERAARYASPGDQVTVVGTARARVVAVTTEGAHLDPSVLRRGWNDLDHAKAFLREHGMEAGIVLVTGDPVHAILKMAEQQRANLIIVGYDRAPLLDGLHAALSDRVAHRSECDVLVVH